MSTEPTQGTDPVRDAEATDPAPTSGDWRNNVRNSRKGTSAVLAATLLVVGGGAWYLSRGSSQPTTVEAGQGAAAATVQLAGDQSGPAPTVGQAAPGFTVTTMDGRKVSLASLKGHPVWITFGATWCTACRAEAPDIQQAWNEKKGDGLELLAVFVSEDASTVRGYANRLNLDFPMVSDPDTTLSSRYRSIGIPSHFFIDKNGILRESHVGALTPQMMTDDLAKIGA